MDKILSTSINNSMRRCFFALIIFFFLITSLLITLHITKINFWGQLSTDLRSALQNAVMALNVWKAQHDLVLHGVLDVEDVYPTLMAGGLEQSSSNRTYAPAEEQLIELLASFSDRQKTSDFYVIDRSNKVLLSSDITSIGAYDYLNVHADELEEMWSASADGPRVFQGLGSGVGSEGNHNRSLFIGSLVNLDSQHVVLLILRIMPDLLSMSLLDAAIVGQTGRAYLFDREGEIIFQSKKSGVIRESDATPDGKNSLSIALPIQMQPDDESLPRAEEVGSNELSGVYGEDLSGYTNHQGQKVIGAWLWDTDLNIGMAVEQRYDEAYTLFNVIKKIIISGLSLVSGVLVFSGYRIVNSKQLFREIESQLNAVVTTAKDGIIIIEKSGLIKGVNPALENLFYYRRSDIVGENIDLLIPEMSQKGSYLQSASGVKNRGVIGGGINLEVFARRADGSKFPVELSMNELKLRTGTQYAGVIRDISQQRLYEEQIESERRFIQSIIDNLSEPIAVIDNLGAVVYSNSEFFRYSKIIGLHDFSLGCDYLSVVKNNSRGYTEEEAAFYNEVKSIMAGVKHGASMLHSYDVGDRHYWFDLQAKKVKLNQRQLVLIVCLDLTEVKANEEMLIKAREEAEFANRAKSSFLATISHEIRTPLNGIVASIDMLLHKNPSVDQFELIQTAQKSSELLQSIIDDVLDFSRIESGHLDLEYAPVLFESVIDSLRDSLLPVASSSQVELVLFCDPNLPVVDVDETRIKQVLFNLIGNAIKFSSDLPDRSGRVYVSLVGHRAGDRRVNLNLQVEDNGIGIANNFKDHLFQPFLQADINSTRRHEGSGLGLAITKAIVDQMGGEISFASEPNKGTTFKVDLPLMVSDIESNSATDTFELCNVFVWLALQDSRMSYVIQEQLSSQNIQYRSISTDNAQLINSESVVQPKQIIIFDSQWLEEAGLSDPSSMAIEESGMSYLKMTRGIHFNPRMLSESSFELDFDAMSRVSLLKTITCIAEGCAIEKLFLATPDALPPLVIRRGESKRADRLILLVEDNITNQRVIKNQIETLGFAVDLASNGRDALALCRSNRYLMILTDCHMAIMSGYEFTERYRKQQRPDCHTPIIGITADALRSAAKRCIQSGMDAVLTKPIQLREMYTLFETWLPDHLMEDDGDADPVALTDSDHDDGEKQSNVIDPIALQKVLGTNDPAKLVNYYQHFVTTSSDIINELASANDDLDYDRLDSLTHKFKSSSMTIGAEKLVQICEQIQSAVRDNEHSDIAHQIVAFDEHFVRVKSWIDGFSARG